MTRWDICVVGAGPSGSYAAYELAGAGYRVLLLEEHVVVGEPRHCTGILGQEAFDRIPGLPRDVIQSDLKAAWLVSPSGSRVRTEWFQGKAMVIDRARFDQRLAEMACAAGAVLQTDRRVESIATGPNGVSVTAVDASGARESYEASALIVASGISYRLHAQAGLEAPTQFLHCAQTEVSSAEIGEVEVYIGKQVAPGSFAWAVPIGGGKLRVGVTSHRAAAPSLEALLAGARLRDRIQRNGVPVQKRMVPIRAVETSAADRVLLVGDAAGQVKPTTGGGIYYGLLGARVAAKTLRAGLESNRLDRAFLQSYDREWKRLLRRETWMGRIGRMIFERFSDAQLDRLVRVCADEKVSKIVNRHADFDWHSTSVLSFLMSRRVLSQLF